MRTEKVERAVGELIAQISRSEIKLPELQREFVWKPTQVANFLDSLYRGYPSGSLLFWETDEDPGVREMAIGVPPDPSHRAPFYLIDGQQRLTSLHRVFGNHPEAQIVFHVDSEQFRNQTNSVRDDPRWVKVATVVDTASLFKLTKQLIEAGCTSSEDDIHDRLHRLQRLRDRKLLVEILSGFNPKQMAEIFVRINSGGRHLDRSDLALAMLSADWPGMVGRLQKEADYWRGRSFGDLDVNFLSRALAAVTRGRGLTSWEPGRVPGDKMDQAWEVVKRGLHHLVRLLRADLRLTRSDVIPSVSAMIPLIVLLGERPDGPLDRETKDAIVYWFLVATVRDRYSGRSETKLRQDIAAARKPKAIESLLRGLGDVRAVTPAALDGRTKESSYFFLSLLVTHFNGALDWWHGTGLMSGFGDDQRLEHHHIHPVATLEAQYDKAEINELANLAFISGKANRRISYKSPRAYFPELGDRELSAHFVPLDESLRDAERFLEFLAARRRLLADAMTAFLDRFRPKWLDTAPAAAAEPTGTDGLSMRLVQFASAWDKGHLLFVANVNGRKWTGAAIADELEQVVTAAGVAGIPGDIEVGAESVSVEVVEDSVEVPVGPFILTGTPEEWAQVFERERSSARSLASYRPQTFVMWDGGERLRFPITSTE